MFSHTLFAGGKLEQHPLPFPGEGINIALNNIHKTTHRPTIWIQYLKRFTRRLKVQYNLPPIKPITTICPSSFDRNGYWKKVVPRIKHLPPFPHVVLFWCYGRVPVGCVVFSDVGGRSVTDFGSNKEVTPGVPPLTHFPGSGRGKGRGKGAPG